MLIQSYTFISAQKHLTSIINEAIELYRVNQNQINIETYRAIKTRVNLDIIDVEDPENKNIQRKGIVGFIFAFLSTFSFSCIRSKS